ncbi:MAG TPA: hypothetical protein EYP18_10085 [Desulfobacterales bacterium]|nr:hypothetical protein [Desulfobacterales bacterium]
MPHAFSVEIQDFISNKIQLMEEAKTKAIHEKNNPVQFYCEGQLLELMNLRKYLTENIDLKTQKYY